MICLNGIDFQSYLAMNPNAIPPVSEQAVGVITVQGAIMESGLSSSDVASAEDLVEQIRVAKNDERIKALVLRVDSPGGSAFASELIREELLALQAAGKPVVASFATVAASGGYWVSASADAIFRRTHHHHRLHWHFRHSAQRLREFGCPGYSRRWCLQRTARPRPQRGW
jgi:ClpP class serine protease